MVSLRKTSNTDKVEYLSNTNDEWIDIDDMVREHLVNMVKKLIRTEYTGKFRITDKDGNTHKKNVMGSM